jgi:hypothetical protein
MSKVWYWTHSPSFSHLSTQTLACLSPHSTEKTEHQQLSGNTFLNLRPVTIILCDLWRAVNKLICQGSTSAWVDETWQTQTQWKRIRHQSIHKAQINMSESKRANNLFSFKRNNVAKRPRRDGLSKLSKNKKCQTLSEAKMLGKKKK